MGYWATSPEGHSFVEGATNPDGTEMLWGDAPADRIDDGLSKLIKRLKGELGRWPTVAEVDIARPEAPEMLAAIEKARKTFAEDMADYAEEDGVKARQLSDGELAAGLRFCDTKIHLDGEMERDINVGDEVKFAGRDIKTGRFVYILADGKPWVPSSPFDDYPEGAKIWLRTGILLSDPHMAPHLVQVDDELVEVPLGYISRVLPEDLIADDVKVN